MQNMSENKLTQEYALEMLDICKSFPGVRALDNAKIQVKKGSIHALMGENGAGKSTMMKCLFGVYKEDSGNIFIDGKQMRFSSPKEALDNGVAMVHQELNQVIKRSCADNIWLGRYETTWGFIHDREILKKTNAVFSELGISLTGNMIMEDLSVSQRQMAEIAKAVSYKAKILVLDEPTSSLTDDEVEHLFKILKMLRERGCAIIYISHKMEEILEISDEVTVMRDGKWVATTNAGELTTDIIIKQMVGRSLENRFPERKNVPGNELLSVKNVSTVHNRKIKNISFELRKSEILGVAGLVGSGRSEMLEAIFGRAQRGSGEIILGGKKQHNRSPRESIENGFALLTEERRADGIFSGLDIKFNSCIAALSKYSKFSVLDGKSMIKDTDWVIKSMHVKTPSQSTHIGDLSGGNQQKVIIGRWLLTAPDVLLLDEPTRGIDVGAKYEIYQLIIDLAATGKGIVMVSSEMPELLGICDRILVMSGGEIAGILDNDGALTQEEIMRLAAKNV